MTEDEVVNLCRMFGLDWSPMYYPARGPHMSISCPFAFMNHQDPTDKNKGFSVSIVPNGTSLGRCFSTKCGKKGSMWWLVREAVKAMGNPPGLVKIAEDLANKERPTYQTRCVRISRYNLEFKEPTQHREEVFYDEEEVYTRFQDLPDEAVSYLYGRSIVDEDIDLWQMRWDDEKKRVVFPVRRKDGVIVGFSGRTLGTSSVKYLCYDGLLKTRYLFGEHFLEPGATVIPVEGQMDVIAVARAFRVHNLEKFVPVASLGEGFSDHHVATIRGSKPKNIVIFPDGDDAGEVFATKVYEHLKREMPSLAQPIARKPEPESDPGDTTEENIVRLVQEAKVIQGTPKIACLRVHKKKS